MLGRAPDVTFDRMSLTSMPPNGASLDIISHTVTPIAYTSAASDTVSPLRRDEFRVQGSKTSVWRLVEGLGVGVPSHLCGVSDRTVRSVGSLGVDCVLRVLER